MHPYFYKILHFLPQFTHLSLICHLILQYSKVYLIDTSQEDRISLTTYLIELTTLSINPRVLIPIIGLLMQLEVLDEQNVQKMTNALLDVALLSSSQPHKQLAYDYLHSLCRLSQKASIILEKQISAFKITIQDSSSIKQSKLSILLLLSDKFEEKSPSFSFILAEIHYWLIRGDRKSKELITICLSQSFQTLGNTEFKNKIQEYLMQSFQKRENLNIQAQKALFESVLAKTSEDQLALLFSLFKISKEKQIKEGIKSIICSLISRNVKKIPNLALETLRQFALNYKANNQQFSLSVLELCIQILGNSELYSQKLQKKTKIIINSIMNKNCEGNNFILKSISKKLRQNMSEIEKGNLELPRVKIESGIKSDFSFAIPWLSNKTKSIKLKDQLIPKNFTIIDEKEKPALEKFSIEPEAVKIEKITKLKGNFEATNMEAQIRISKKEKGREFTNLTQDDLDDFFSN